MEPFHIRMPSGPQDDDGQRPSLVARIRASKADVPLEAADGSGFLVLQTTGVAVTDITTEQPRTVFRHDDVEADLLVTDARVVLSAPPRRRRRAADRIGPGAPPRLTWQVRYEWLERFGAGAGPGLGPEQLRFVVKVAGDVERRLALDVGLGSGSDALNLAQQVARRVGAFWDRQGVPNERRGWVVGLRSAPRLSPRRGEFSLYRVPMAVPVEAVPEATA